MNDELLEHLVKPMSFEELQEHTGMSGAILIGTMRALERDGKVRFTRGLYERTQSVVAMVDQPAAPIEHAPVKKTPEPPAVPAARPAAPAATPPATSEDTTMAKRVCSSGADCVDGGEPKPTSAFYRPEDGKCKKCVLKRQRELKLAKSGGKPAPKAGKAPPPKAAVTQPARALAVPTAPVITSAHTLLLPAQPRFAAGIENRNGYTRVQLANDQERVVELTPAQMDQLCEWWRAQARTDMHP